MMSFLCATDSNMLPIEKLANRYNDFQQYVGSVNNANFEAKIPELFSEHFTKTINGDVAVKNREALEKQLKEVRETAGTWEIVVTRLIPAANNHDCTIRYMLISQNCGTFNIFAILASENGITIDSIEEVYYTSELPKN